MSALIPLSVPRAYTAANSTGASVTESITCPVIVFSAVEGVSDCVETVSDVLVGGLLHSSAIFLFINCSCASFLRDMSSLLYLNQQCSGTHSRGVCPISHSYVTAGKLVTLQEPV